MNNSSELKLFGRDKEIAQLYDTVNSKHNSITYILGESGIGKSALLEEFHRGFRDNSANFLVGFYSQYKILIGESPSPIYPFKTVLEDLLEWAKTTEKHDDKIKGIMTRVENAFKKFAKEKGSEMIGAILYDIAKKMGLDQTLKIAQDLIEDIREEKSALMSAISYAREHNDEFVMCYVRVIQSLLREFQGRNLDFLLF